MQGFNMGRYVPPDQEGLTTGNRLSGKHPLGSRARNLRTTGALVVRFEMPFAVWCTTCKPHETLIGQGVRFNAEKKKVGNYHSTPIYRFRMKHTQCGGWIEIETDPKNTAYVVTKGGRKRDTGEDRVQEGEIRIRLPTERGGGEGQEEDPFARLEGKAEDKKQAETATSRILELKKRQDRAWEDPYEQSKRLRKTFRVERRSLEKAEANREALKDKMSLDIDLVDETEEDRLRASAVDFNTSVADNDASGINSARNIRLRPMFASKSPLSSSSLQKAAKASSEKHGKRRKPLPKPTDPIAARKATLRNELTGNTRAIVDPFLTGNDEMVWRPETKKRKQNSDVHQHQNKSLSAVKDNGHSHNDEKDGTGVENESTHVELGEQRTQSRTGYPAATPIALVNYASDSD